MYLNYIYSHIVIWPYMDSNIMYIYILLYIYIIYILYIHYILYIYISFIFYIAHHLILLQLYHFDLRVDREGWWFDYSVS